MIVISTLITRYLLYAPCVGKDIPSFRRGLGRFWQASSIFTYLSVKQIDTMVFAELVTLVY